MTAVDLTTTTSGVNLTGSSTQGIKTVRHPVSDLATAKAVYAALLGVPPQNDGPWWPPSPIPTATFWACSRTEEHRPPNPWCDLA